MSVRRCKREVTSREFVMWMVWLQEQTNKREPIHFYLAQIALEVRRSINPKKRWKLKDFLLNFKSRKKYKPPETPEEKAAYLKRSKSFWMALTGQRGKKPPPKK